MYVYNIHSYCVRLGCADYILFVIYLFYTQTDVVVSLFIISSINICVSVAFVLSFLMLNEIRLLNNIISMIDIFKS